MQEITLPIEIPVENYLTHEIYYLRDLGTVSLYERYYPDIIKCCNEPTIYDRLFRESRKGTPYQFVDVCQILSIANSGWKNRMNYIFAVTNAKQEFVGMLEIKTTSLESDEIGYWISETAKGIASNAVATLCKWAKEHGFKRLHAYVNLNNQASQKVLINNKFTRYADREYPLKKQLYAFFEKEL